MYEKLQNRGINSVLLFLIIIQSVFYILLFPNLEYPDASAHIRKIYLSTNDDLYFKMMYSVRIFIENQLGIYENITTVRNPDFSYFNWETINLHSGSNYYTVMIMQSINIFVVLLSYFLLRLMILKSNRLELNQKNMLIKATLLYYAYPAVSYLIVGITPDFLIYIYQPFFIYFIFSKKHIVNLCGLVLLYIFEDDGAMINILFLLIYFLNHFVSKIKGRMSNWIIALFYSSFLIALYFVSRKYINLFINSDNDILFIMQNSINNYGNLPTKVLNFILSAFYLLGSGSYITFPLLYIIFVYFIYKIIRNSIAFKVFSTLDNLMYTSIVTVTLMIILYPPYSHVRFFLFFIFIFLLGMFKYVLKDEYFNNEKVYLKFFLFFVVHNIILIFLIYFFS